MSRVAVVILNYNGKNYLEQFLPPLIEYSSEAEIIVADNASTDDSTVFLQSNYPNLRLIKSDKNYGFAGGYNHALKDISSEYTVLLNSDVEVTKDWLHPLLTFLEEHNQYAAVQPKILDFNKREYFEYAGAAGGFIDILGYPYCRGRIFDRIELDQGQYDEEMDISWGSGACLLVRTNIFKETGGFDSDFFAHMEEIDWCWRLHNAGFKIRCVPQSLVYHVGGGTLASTSPFKTYLNFRNGLFLLIKNLPLFTLLWKLPTRVFLDWVAIVRFILSGQLNHAISIIKAHWSVLKLFGKMYGKRGITRRGLTSTYSIVFKYFVLGRRKYVQL